LFLFFKALSVSSEMRPRKIPQDCIYEGTGSLGNDGELQPNIGSSSSPIAQENETSEHGFVHRWHIDTKSALNDLRRALKIDAHPPPLDTLAPPKMLAVSDLRQRYGGLDLGAPTNGMLRDASQLLLDATRLLGSLGVASASPTELPRAVEELHRRISLLRPGFAAELTDRVEATTKEAAKWQEGKSDVCREIACNDEQLRETVQLVQFLNTEVSPAVPMVFDAARQMQTLAPLFQAASDRLTYLSVIVETPVEKSMNHIQQLAANLAEMNAAIEESEDACAESIAALQERFEKLKARKRLR
jgi:hypothetical protein